MKATVSIDGRDAVPVRAIPFVTGWRIAPDALVKDLARHDHRARHKDYLRAYQFEPANGYPEIHPAEWDQILVRLDALENDLERHYFGGSEANSYLRWREEAPLLLPRGCFVWQDEFVEACRRGWMTVSVHEHDEELKLSFFPLVPTGKEIVLMEGFEQLDDLAGPRTNSLGKWPWGSYETELLSHLAAAAEKHWVRFDPADFTTAPKNNDVIKWLKDRDVTENIAKAIATILRHDGLPTGPRK